MSVPSSVRLEGRSFVHTQGSTETCVHTHMYTQTRVHTHMHTQVETHTHAKRYTHTQTHAHRDTCTHRYRDTCTHRHMHTRTHAHKHIHNTHMCRSMCISMTSLVSQLVKNSSANAADARDTGSIPGSGRSPGEGNANPLQYSCLENPTEKRGGL